MNDYRGPVTEEVSDHFPPHAPLEMPRQTLERDGRLGVAALLSWALMRRA